MDRVSEDIEALLRVPPADLLGQSLVRLVAPLNPVVLPKHTAYHTLLVSGRHSATIGMRAFGLQLHSWNGERPVFLQALAHTALFYVTVGLTGSLILLFALFNRRRCTLHDVLTGMLMLRRPNGARTGPDPWRP